MIVTQTRPAQGTSCFYLKSSERFGNMSERVLFQYPPPICQVQSTSHLLPLNFEIPFDQLPQLLLQGEKSSQVFCAARNILLQ